MCYGDGYEGSAKQMLPPRKFQSSPASEDRYHNPDKVELFYTLFHYILGFFSILEAPGLKSIL